ncbi:hypothetical protein CALVIDRAFT_141748 [Calocera viscosa TUFC12733]|uniref:Uncharacterized protein n=1 Tax=Calocera viscosa (strain TUFC12733) TaxID=1330018 RepID=A0A167LQ46_CALVF|nr:hypothetical protein CALVIDRAFT_141748 [Calocera viscosa TUFC12733]
MAHAGSRDFPLLISSWSHRTPLIRLSLPSSSSSSSSYTMSSQSRTWGSRFAALKQESTPSSPELHPCATPSPLVSPLGLGPPTTSARDRTTTAPEHSIIGGYNNIMGDTSIHGRIRSTSYNIGVPFNNQSQQGLSYGHRIRHEASVFVAGYVTYPSAYTHL